MAEKWEAWAIEANAKPWPWNRNKKNLGSKKKTFNLDANANLTKELSPMIRKKSFEVEVHIEKQGEGILVAQGGDTHGWVLFVRDNFAHFSLSLGGKIETIKANKKLTEKEGKIVASLNPNGIVELFAGKRKLGSGKVSSLVKEMPIDGLQVGRDEGGTVGDYKDAFDFDGKIKKVRIKIN